MMWIGFVAFFSFFFVRGFIRQRQRQRVDRLQREIDRMNKEISRRRSGK